MLTAMRSLMLCTTAILLSGCITAGPRDRSTAVIDTPAELQRSIETGADGAASTSTLLLEQGRAERDAGDYAVATSTIERALRIDPNNPELWLELAEIKYAQNDREQGALMAQKALALAGGDRSVETRARRLFGR